MCDRCETISKVADTLELTSTVDPQLPPREEFELGCEKFADEQY